jgi:hypothetical protein
LEVFPKEAEEWMLPRELLGELEAASRALLE